eukprot:762997-Hanusia_phi.AAC.9
MWASVAASGKANGKAVALRERRDGGEETRAKMLGVTFQKNTMLARALLLCLLVNACLAFHSFMLSTQGCNRQSHFDQRRIHLRLAAKHPRCYRTSTHHMCKHSGDGNGRNGNGGSNWRGWNSRKDEGEPELVKLLLYPLSRRKLLCAGFGLSMMIPNIVSAMINSSKRVYGTSISGFPEMEFNEADIPDVWNDRPRYVIVTGANTGIGYEMSRILAAKGWHVILACRSRERGISAVNEIISDIGSHARIEFMELDLSSLESVCNFARKYSMKMKPLNLLINNAGIMLAPHSMTEDGIEQTFQVNFVGPYLLTNLLLPKIRGSTSAEFPSRIVNVGSVALRWAPRQGVILNMTTINDPANYERLNCSR